MYHCFEPEQIRVSTLESFHYYAVDIVLIGTNFSLQFIDVQAYLTRFNSNIVSLGSASEPLEGERPLMHDHNSVMACQYGTRKLTHKLIYSPVFMINGHAELHYLTWLCATA